MPGYAYRTAVAGASLWLTATAIGFAADGTLSAPELRGQAIYRTGVSPSGQPIVATLSGGTEIPAKNLPCAGCHGRDGRGRPESGVFPSNIAWEELTRPYEVTAPSGRRRTAYNDSLAIRAITMGIDASGNRLDSAMPRFVMSRADAVDLIAYLKRIAADRDPGISGSSVKIGVLLPQGQSAPIVNALRAYFEDWNARGGVYNRRVELAVGALPPAPAKAAAAYADFLARERVFALLNSFMAGAESEIGAFVEKEQVPLIGPLTLLPPTSNSVVFGLDSGLPGQVDALANYALRGHGREPDPVAIVADDALPLAAWGALRVKLERFTAPRNAAEADDLTRRLSAKRAPAAFLFMPAEQLRILIEAGRRNSWNAALLIPGAFAPADLSLLKQSAGPVVLAMPFLPSDITADAKAEWSRLAELRVLETSRIAGQWSALCNARILVEGLKRAGRDLSRENLVEALNGLHDFSCGYKQLVSFAPGRRVGIDKVHIVTLDQKSGGLIETGSRGARTAGPGR
jgi:ABC-type branched-subunit amino acid transport system substrate-binding protein